MPRGTHEKAYGLAHAQLQVSTEAAIIYVHFNSSIYASIVNNSVPLAAYTIKLKFKPCALERAEAIALTSFELHNHLNSYWPSAGVLLLLLLMLVL